MHPGHAAGRLLPLVALIFLSTFSGSGTAQQLIPVSHDPRPKRDGSLQFISYTPPTHWDQLSGSDITVLIYIKQGPASGPGLEQFGSPILMRYDHSRIAYQSYPDLNGRVSFRILLYSHPEEEFAITDVEEIMFNRPILGPIPQPSIYAGTQPRMPEPNLDPQGDVYVDPVRGDDANDGGLTTPVRTIGQGMRRINARFTTPADRAGKHLILRGGNYEGSDSPFDSVINLVNYQGGVPGNNFTIRGYPGEKVRLRGHQGQRSFYYFAVELGKAKHLTLENMVVDNASYMEAINVDLTEGVALRFMEVYAFGSKWGVQAFGEVTDFLAEGCRFSGATGEHNVYVAAGTETPGKLGRRIVFRGNEFDHANWWGLQVNGTVQDVLIENNLFWENGVGPLTVKGSSGVTIRNNTMVGNNRQISIESYFDTTYFHNGYGPDPVGMGRGDVNDWWRTHFSTVGYIDIVYNTIVLPEDACMPAHGSGPAEKSAIVLVEFAGADVNGYPIAEPFKHVRINNNILVSQHQAILDASVTNPLEHDRSERMIESFEVTDNLFFSEGGPVAFGRTKSPVLERTVGVVASELGGQPSSTDVTYVVPGRSPMPVGEPLAELEARYSGWSNNLFDQRPLFWYLAPCTGYEAGVFYDWENIRYQGDLKLNPSSPAVDRGRLATYAGGKRHLLFEDGTGRRRLLAPDLGARESHDW